MSNSSIWSIGKTTRWYHSRPEWTWEWWQWRGTPHFSKLQHSDCFVLYPRHILGVGILTPMQRCSWCILQLPANWTTKYFSSSKKKFEELLEWWWQWWWLFLLIIYVLYLPVSSKLTWVIYFYNSDNHF